MFKKKYLLLTLFLIIIFQILLYTNNNQKTSFRYFKWTLPEVSIGKLISISFFSGLIVITLLNTTITSTSFRKKTFEKVEDDCESYNNDEEMEPNFEMPPQRDIRETQPTISVNYRVVKNMNDNNFKKDQSYSNQDIEPNVEMPPQRDLRETQPTISVNYRVVKNMNNNNLKKDLNYSNPDNEDDWDNADNDW